MRIQSALTAVLILGGSILAGCTTTEDANRALQSRWIGQPVERFFAAYGPPISEYPLSTLQLELETVSEQADYLRI